MKIKRNCDYCNRLYISKTQDVNRGWGLCCSKSCAAKKREKQKDIMNLQLSLKAYWFEMTKAGIKKEDYREINKYWIQRLMHKLYNREAWKNEQAIIDNIIENKEHFEKNRINKFLKNTMTLGYPKSYETNRILVFEHAGIEIREGNPDWGAEPGTIYFVIKHGKRL